MGELRCLRVKNAGIVPHYIGHTTQSCDRHDESASTGIKTFNMHEIGFCPAAAARTCHLLSPGCSSRTDYIARILGKSLLTWQVKPGSSGDCNVSFSYSVL